MIDEQQHRRAVEAAFREGWRNWKKDDDSADELWFESSARRQLEQLAAPEVTMVPIPRSVAEDCQKLIRADLFQREHGGHSAKRRDLLDRLERALPLVADSISSTTEQP